MNTLLIILLVLLVIEAYLLFKAILSATRLDAQCIALRAQVEAFKRVNRSTLKDLEVIK